MSEQDKKRGPGRPKGTRKYADLGQDYGAPKLTVRLDPELLAWVKAQQGGARATLEDLIRTAMRSDS